MQEPPPRLVRAAAAGDDEAFAELVRRAQPHLWRFLVHLVSDHDVAADLVQDTLVSAHRALPGFRFESSLSTWLLRIARNAATDHHRRSARQERLAARAAEVARSSVPDISDAAEVRAAIAALPLHLREVFVLVEVFGLRYREAAEVLDVPEGTVKSRMFNARRQLVAWFTADSGAGDGGQADAGEGITDGR
ncbi:MAG TPA: sigma-70 family RNA polymerase sigma factor [Euzebya sp.]|nr:sigma-70 family RNA polymerase sigma factor [Euzebya sp.]